MSLSCGETGKEVDARDKHGHYRKGNLFDLMEARSRV
jgi:hypothetical protein